LWNGESDVQEIIPKMSKELVEKGYAFESQGAMVIDVSENSDTSPMPPFILSKSDGSSLYSTTDLATILQRYNDLKPDEIWYIVDSRQALHFKQVFRCAYKTGLVPVELQLLYFGFGTMNGTDGKPFKTRDGSVMKLNTLIETIEDNVLKRIEEEKVGIEYNEEEKSNITHLAGIAALKYGDLMNMRTKDYIFDIDKFTSFEGRTGAYLLYSTVRIKSILKKARAQGMLFDAITIAESDIERELQLQISLFPEYVNAAINDKAPNYICDFVYNVASLSNKFYHEHNIMKETDSQKRAKWLALLEFTHDILVTSLDLLGIKVPEKL
jgi:arginyl-tRNA synthetase